MPAKSYSLIFLGDVMLGRLVDQLMRTHVHCPSEAHSATQFLKFHPHLQSYSAESPWGNALPFLRKTDLLLINLETAVTTHDVKWPDKAFNYRMHPENLKVLKVANVNYAGLANNHTLDFCEKGLQETVKSAREAEIKFAGAGETDAEARGPALLKLRSEGEGGEHEVHVYAASDHPSNWGGVKEFNLIDYSLQTRERLKAELMSTEGAAPALKIFSVHWGPNYAWQPAQWIRDLAHFLIDECGVDVIHGHSSHHVQGVEVYKGKVIIYGCGDFVDDYAIVAEYRNDLSAAWRVVVEEEEGKKGKLRPIRLEVCPSRIKHFQAQMLERGEADWVWVREKVVGLSSELGTVVREGEGKLEVMVS